MKTWADDKKLILDKLVEIYDEINSSINRYDASKALFDHLDFFVDRLIGDDQVIMGLMNIDEEFVNGYLNTMSELMGEEK